jgi:hypothetical protein
MAIIEGGSSGNLAEVTTGNLLKVITETNVAANPANVGAVRMFSENDPGTATGTALLRSPESSLDFRLRTGMDNLWDDENFNYAAQNTSKYRHTLTTLTVTYSAGFMNLNGGSVTTTATGAIVSTYRYFPIFGASPSYFESMITLNAAAPTNCNMDFGFMLPNTATTIPLDGVYFRINSSGVFGVLNNNATEVTTSAFSSFTLTPNTVNKYVVAVHRDHVEFWINDVLYGTINKPTSAGAASFVAALPVGFKQQHTGTTSAAVQLRVANYNVSCGEFALNRSWNITQAGMGLSSIQGASGMTQGQTANYANSAAPASATLSNTAAGYTTLGGQFQFAAVAGAETDYALFGYQVTTPTTLIQGRNLVVRGIHIDTINTGAAVATTATVLQWSLGVGSTAVSLATAEATATRARRVIPLGIQSFAIGTAIGAQAQRIDVDLDAAAVVEPGTFLHIILKMPLGTATASQVIRGVVGINAYWE